MKSWQFNSFGDISNLKQVDIERPKSNQTDALVKISYASLNPADRYMVEGLYPGAGTLPFSVGRDGSGIVEEPAIDSEFKKGDRVVVLRSELGVKRDGTLAEFVKVPEESLALIPDNWSDQEAAAAALVHLTAWQGLVDVGQINSESTVLITGASGGVGIAALQQAKAFGAKVVALSRSSEKQKTLKELGADGVFDPTDPDLLKNVKAYLAGGRVDIVIENIAGPFLQKCIKLAGYKARIAIVGLLAGLHSEIEIAQLIFKRISIHGIHVGSYSPQETQEIWKKIVQCLDKTNAKPLIDHVYSFDQVQEAFAHLKEGAMGKILVGPMALS